MDYNGQQFEVFESVVVPRFNKKLLISAALTEEMEECRQLGSGAEKSGGSFASKLTQHGEAVASFVAQFCAMVWKVHHGNPWFTFGFFPDIM